MSQEINQHAMQQLFMDARSFNSWKNKSISEGQIKQIYDLTKMGPTSANSCPARFVFITSEQAKEKLKDCLDEGNVEKSMSAPAVAIIGMDMEFYEQLPKLFPHGDARSWYAGKDEKIFDAAFRNSSLQGAYLIMAIRSLGLDAGPMSGFDSEKLDAAFFSGSSNGTVKSNFICAFGYGDDSTLYPRGPRLDFTEAASIE